jgi:hypothetical protein
MKLAKEMSPNFFHKCPYVGVVAVNNFTVERKYITFAPTGKYKGIVNYTDGKNILFQIKYEYTMS